MNFQHDSSDQFLNILYNQDSPIHFVEDSKAEQRWMFEINEEIKESNPFYEPIKPAKQVIKKQCKEDQIIKENKDLFQANQAKSIYLTKISQLVETPRIQPKAKRSRVVQDSDSSDYGNGKSKLAKNRESARNSRKRKKVYIELLETKVQELTEQINQLQSQLNQRNINYEQMSREYAESIKNTRDLQGIVNLQEQYGVNSPKRWTVCTDLINQLIDATIPYELKRLLESAQKGTDFFADSIFGLSKFNDLKEKFKMESVQLELLTQKFGHGYDKLREQTLLIERLKCDLVQMMPAQDYTNYLN